VAETFWRERIGAEMEQTCCAKTSKGHHYYFAIAPGDKIQSWAVAEAESGIKFDVQAEGKGVMTPPSPHPDGGYYEWIRPPEAMLPCPTVLLDGGQSYRAGIPPGQGATRPGVTPAVTGGPTPASSEGRSLLSELLRRSPTAGNRNDWLIRVCGHIAKLIPFEDAYRELVRMANSTLDEPLEQVEVDKTATSAWESEKSKGLTTIEKLKAEGIVSGTPDEANGWLVGSGKTLLSPCLVKSGDSKEEVLKEWANFDIEVLGVIVGEETTDYLIKLTTINRVIECRLDGTILGSPRELLRWLAERQCSSIQDPNDMHPRVGENKRLQRYLESQEAPQYKSADALGWNDAVGGFLTHEGIIRAGASSIEPFGDMRPSSILLDWAPYRYSFAGTRDEARRTLQQILTFHDETVTAVYGAWWAACFLKVQIMAESSLFPFMALEAPSESGKTTGFFQMMVQLGGNHEGHGEFTMAALRDRVSGHRNGQVWIDDTSDPEQTWDLVRQTTSEGSRTKKQTDRHHQERINLVAPIVISAEGLAALATEKALADRAVRLSVPSPTGRISLIDPSRPQWDDIKDLQAQYQGDLTQISGWFVSMALDCLPMVSQIRELRPTSGRHGDKMAILRLGARVLEMMSGNTRVVELVDAWCAGWDYMKGDNILTTEIIPKVLRETKYPTAPSMYWPVYVDRQRIVWYSESGVADWWKDQRNLTIRQRQLGSEESLKGQRRDLGIEGTGRIKDIITKSGEKRQKRRFHPLPADISALVIGRAEMVHSDEEEGQLQ